VLLTFHLGYIHCRLGLAQCAVGSAAIKTSIKQLQLKKNVV